MQAETAEVEIERTDEIIEAERRLKDLVTSGASEAKIEEAESELDGLIAASKSKVQRELRRGRLKAIANLETAEATRRKRQEAADRAESEFLSSGPVVAITWHDFHCAISLTNPTDGLVRQTTAHGIKETVRVVYEALLTATGAVRNGESQNSARDAALARLDSVLPEILLAVRRVAPGSVEIGREAL